MKRFFEYIGLTVLFLFSYYYTGKIGELMSDKETIMVNLEEKNEKLNPKCTEGYYEMGGVVLGITGFTIDIEESYHNMKGLGYDEELIKYDKDECLINQKNSLDKVIVKGNPYKNSVSILVDTISFNYINDFIIKSKEKNISISIIIDDSIFNKYKNELIKIYNSNVEILYRGKNIKNISKTFSNVICLYDNNLNECKEEKISTIKVNDYYNKNSLMNIKKNIEKGDFIVLEESKINLEEFIAIINYIDSKGLNIISVSEHLK